jgi:hypothetical protein
MDISAFPASAASMRMSLPVLILGSLIAITSAVSKIPTREGLLYYKDSQLYSFAEAMKFCANMGGEPPHDLSLDVIKTLMPTLNDFDVGYWLDAEHGRGGYRWQKTGIQIPAELWLPEEPNCDTHHARLGCRVSIHPKSGRLLAHQGSDRLHALCAINFTDSEAVSKLRAKMSHGMNVDDRIEIEKIILRSELMKDPAYGSSGSNNEVKQQHEEEAKTHEDIVKLNKKMDNVVNLLHSMLEDLQDKRIIFPMIRS